MKFQFKNRYYYSWTNIPKFSLYVRRNNTGQNFIDLAVSLLTKETCYFNTSVSFSLLHHAILILLRGKYTFLWLILFRGFSSFIDEWLHKKLFVCCWCVSYTVNTWIYVCIIHFVSSSELSYNTNSKVFVGIQCKLRWG